MQLYVDLYDVTNRCEAMLDQEKFGQVFMRGNYVFKRIKMILIDSICIRPSN